MSGRVVGVASPSAVSESASVVACVLERLQVRCLSSADEHVGQCRLIRPSHIIFCHGSMSLALALAVVILAGKATSKYCDGDYFCTPPKECCTLGCCYLYSQPTPNLFNLVVWNHWYLWCVIVVGVALCCACGCGLWKRRGGAAGRAGAGRSGGGGSRSADAASEPDSAGSCYQPPHYSRCSSFHQPPPYAEVTSKPDLYPLVISYSDSSKSGGSYLMVHYFRNYIMRPVGSLSAASTADSLSSSLFCTAANEANSLVPPPYCSAPGSVDQINLHSTSASPLRQVLSQSESQGVVGMGLGGGGGGDCGVGVGCGVGGGGSEQLSNVSSVAGPLGSPPQATTPTLEVQQLQLLSKINQLPSTQGGCSGRLKLSLSRGCRHWLSRSAPSTPSSRLAPAFPSQESSPLLTNNDPDNDNTF